MDWNLCTENETMRIASIDIGTNTILMLIADLEQRSGQLTIKVVRDEMVVARMGRGVDEHRIILPQTFEKVRNHLREYQHIAQECTVDVIFACGTSALRDAANRDEFIAYIKKETGLSIRVLSGGEEAQLTFLGAISEYPSAHDVFGVIDIGGGSTEIITGTHEKVLGHTSLNIGSVRLTERFLTSSPPAPSQLDEATSYIRATLERAQPVPPGDNRLLGVAGTVTTLAALRLQLPRYDPEKISGTRLSIESIETVFEQLRPLTVEQIRDVPQISHGRADIILAGVLILKEYMHHTRCSTITASDRGLRYGIALEAFSI